jgi:uncharacterized protein with FMN-binding domain
MSSSRKSVVTRRLFTQTLLFSMAVPATALSVACGAGADDERATTGGVGADGSAPSASEYTNGDYTATGWYGGLPSSIGVAVTLESSVLTAVTVTPHATDATSLDYQRRFADAVPNVVVGRRIDEVNVGRLAGSSGTPIGFNDALRQIRDQARRR